MSGDGDPDLYFVLSRIDPDRRSRLGDLRADHLSYVLAMAERVHHGGLLTGPDGPDAITMVVSAGSLNEAAELMAGDPYRPLYASVEVSRFIQRIPEAYVGELRQMLDDARAGQP